MTNHSGRPRFSDRNEAWLPSEQSSLAGETVTRRGEFLEQPQTQRAPLTTTPPPPTLLLSAESQAQQCYSFQHIYFGPFDLSAVKFHNISCPHGCSEAVLSLDTGKGWRNGRKRRSARRRERGGAETEIRD